MLPWMSSLRSRLAPRLIGQSPIAPLQGTLHGTCILGKVLTGLYIAFSTTGLRSFSRNRFEPELDRLGPVPNGSVLVQSGPPSQTVVWSSVLEIHERTGLDRTVATLEGRRNEQSECEQRSTECKYPLLSINRMIECCSDTKAERQKLKLGCAERTSGGSRSRGGASVTKSRVTDGASRSKWQATSALG